MRRIYCMLLLLAALFVLPVQGADLLSEQEDALDLDGLAEAGEEYLPGITPGPGLDLEDGLGQVLERGSWAVEGIVKAAIGSGVLLLVIVLLCSLAEGTYGGLGGGGSLDVVSIAGALAITVVAVADVHALIGMGREAIGNMELFSKTLLPTMATATAVSGAPAGAAARQLATMLFSDLLITLQNRLFIPLVYAYVATCTAYAAVGNEGLKRVASGIKWGVTTALTAVMLAFVGYLTVSGVIAGSADAATIKAAKFTISGMVPVVGGILSDAAETVLAGAGILKGAIGIFGMLAVLSICLVPFLQLGIHYLVYKCVAALSATVSGGRVGGLIDGIGGAFGLMLGMTGACALILLVSMVSAISIAAA
jgi:stage III sporulation protein AE